MVENDHSSILGWPFCRFLRYRRIYPLIRYCIIFLLLCCVLLSHSQKAIDTTLILEQIDVDALLPMSQPNHHSLNNQKPGDIGIGPSLNRTALAFVRDYGPGSSATLSFRGGSSQQSDVQWHGVSIGHPMLGLSDISLLQAHLFQNSTITLGSPSALEGSGGLTGVLHLNDHLEDDFTFSASVGSFGQTSTGLKVKFKGAKSITTLKGQWNRSLNNFSYRPYENAPKVEQTNARFYQAGGILDHYHQLSPHHSISFHGWLQGASRAIPPTLTQTRSQAHQQDGTARILAQWKYDKSKDQFILKAGHFRDKIIYEDPLNSFYSPTNGTRTFTDLTLVKKQLHWKWGLGLRGERWTGQANAYENTQVKWRTTARAYSQYEKKKVSISGGIALATRQEALAPIAPDLRLSYNFTRASSIYVRTNYNFRFPGMNDLFWRPGGNLDLRPEKGWNQEIGYSEKSTNEKWKWNISGYHRKIDDWIMWAPLEASGFWSALNIAEVRSYGGHLDGSWIHHWGNQEIKINFQYQWTRSAHLQPIQLPKIEKGDQFLFTPEHRISSYLNWTNGQWMARISNQWTGESPGINNPIPAFHILDISIGRNFNKNNTSGRCYWTINNVLDSDYQIVENRPQPGINFQFSLELNINDHE